MWRKASMSLLHEDTDLGTIFIKRSVVYRVTPRVHGSHYTINADSMPPFGHEKACNLSYYYFICEY